MRVVMHVVTTSDSRPLHFGPTEICVNSDMTPLEKTTTRFPTWPVGNRQDQLNFIVLKNFVLRNAKTVCLTFGVDCTGLRLCEV